MFGYGQIDTVRPGIKSARLEEVNVRIDVTGQNVFALAIDDRVLRGRLRGFVDCSNPIAVDQHRGWLDAGGRGIDDCPINERNLFGQGELSK